MPPDRASQVGLVWFQVGDLRLTDNPALVAAASASGTLVPIFTWSPAEQGDWALGAASRWWLHHSLHALERDLHARGSRLIIRSGESTAKLIATLARQTNAAALYFNRGFLADERSREASLCDLPVHLARFNARVLVEPDLVRARGEAPYRVFSAFWRAVAPGITSHAPEGAPKRLNSPSRWPASEPLDGLGLLPRPDWASELRATWQPGEAGAQRALEHFLDAALSDYQARRDLPEVDGTSRLSPHLHFGELGAGQVWGALQRRHEHAERDSSRARSIEKLKQELGWREFATYLLYHLPRLAEHSLDVDFDDLDWRTDEQLARAWQQGRTGFPFVDAGMRQLWETGWMHNRVRMAVASFLVKDLLLPWQDGARWFWDTLVDADLGNNSVGWQWTAGAGPDAAPFTRVFNPTLQAERFDPRGDYIRRFVPELAALHAPHIFTPWSAPPLALAEAGVTLGRTYPYPIVDHAEARARALALFGERRRSGGPRTRRS